MLPETYSAKLGITVVSKWRGIGLLSAPTLSEGLAHGTPSTSYSITGSASGATPEDQKRNALSELKELKSVISGGKLPVSTVIGSAYVVAPQLGEKFLTYSYLGIFLAIIAVSTVIVIRYRKISLVAPIVIISICEIFITTTIIGVFGTLDLAAMAGIIALIGTGVNDQIIITDEILKRGKAGDEEAQMQYRNAKERIAKAFYIIFAVAGAIIAAMLPLFLSGIVEVMGFALSTIVGVIVGIGITRPAFGVIVQELS
jgi:preprotein translocase subunit SecD